MAKNCIYRAVERSVSMSVGSAAPAFQGDCLMIDRWRQTTTTASHWTIVELQRRPLHDPDDNPALRARLAHRSLATDLPVRPPLLRKSSMTELSMLMIGAVGRRQRSDLRAAVLWHILIAPEVCHLTGCRWSICLMAREVRKR